MYFYDPSMNDKCDLLTKVLQGSSIYHEPSPDLLKDFIINEGSKELS